MQKSGKNIKDDVVLLRRELRKAAKELKRRKLELEVKSQYANYVRNEFGLWDNNEELLKDCLPGVNDRNPDDASAVIIKALWKSLQASA